MAEDKDDLTRLEDLSEYLHEPDPETEKLLSEESETSDLTESDGPPDEFPPEFSSSAEEEGSLDDSLNEDQFSFEEETTEEAPKEENQGNKSWEDFHGPRNGSHRNIAAKHFWRL